MHADIPSAKASLRKRIRKTLAAVPPSKRIEASGRIIALLKSHRYWKEASSILFFAPLPDEPDVWPLITDALSNGKTALLPRFNAAEKIYSAARVQNIDRDTVIGQFGIREPAPACGEVQLSEVDLVLVPGLAFDTHGNRLGRGMGHYDRLLPGVRGIKCGIAFEEQLVEEIPLHSWDVKLNCVLTPLKLVAAS